MSVNWDTDDTWPKNQPEKPTESTISYTHPTPVLDSKPGQIAAKTNRPLIDRLVHHSELIDIDGDSYRLKEAKERAAQLGSKRKKAKP